MIKLKEVTKIFTAGKKQVVAVDNVSFSVSAGEIFGLIGTNGAGKTTVMRMIATMLKPTNGTIEVKGNSSGSEQVRRDIGILFGGDAGLYDRLTAYENIEYFASLNGMTKAEAGSRIKELSSFFGMNDYLHRQAGKFSKGMKQKVCFARSIVHNPPIMLFDEPTSGLDIIAAEEVIKFIKKCKEDGKAVLLSTHDMAEVEELCDRAAIIEKGRILDNEPIGILKSKYNKKTVKEVFFHLTRGGDEN